MVQNGERVVGEACNSWIALVLHRKSIPELRELHEYTKLLEQLNLSADSDKWPQPQSTQQWPESRVLEVDCLRLIPAI